MTTAAQYQKNRTRKDIIVRRLVTLFGCGVLITLLVMIWHLLSQTFPLFLNPSLVYQQQVSFEFSGLVSAGDVLEGEPLIVRTDHCGLAFVNVAEQSRIQKRVLRPCSHYLEVIEDSDQRWLFDVSASGLVRASFVDAGYTDTSTNGSHKPVTFALPESAWTNRQSHMLAFSPPVFAVTLTEENASTVFWYDSRDAEREDKTRVHSDEELLVLPKLNKLITFEDRRFTLRDKEGLAVSSHYVREPINWISTIEQNRSLYIAHGSRNLSRWVIHNQKGRFSYSATYTLQLDEEESPLTIQAHADSNAAILLTNQSKVILFNRVTGEILDKVNLQSPPLDVSWFGDRVYLVYPNKIEIFSLNNPAGVITLKSLFQPMWYEGYAEPMHVYQTAAGSDFNEAKYALVPLFIGSIKAAFSAMFIAVPIAFGAAVYTGFFASSSSRNRVKPIVEMLEAVPSVVIGFIAAILLVPLAEQLLAGIALFLTTVPAVAYGLALSKQQLVRIKPEAIRRGSEVFIGIIAILLWGALCLTLTEDLANNPLFSQWSKTTLVVSVALGVAISPTIYALADDAIYSVPSALKNASFALGATQLQTLKRIVLRVAMPGIIAAVMLGFGRAIGETMIVLMVTGNTPIPDWSLFESLRALTANIAIELPEADVGSALYTLLFFTASALFVFTFIFNTLAEGLRHKMRQQVKYV